MRDLKSCKFFTLMELLIVMAIMRHSCRNSFARIEQGQRDGKINQLCQ